MSLQLKKILVAIDGSENSDYALNLAIKLGTLYLATVDLIHVAIPAGSVVVSPRVFDPLLGTTMVLPTPKIEPGQKKEESSGLPHILADRRQLLLEHGIQCNAIYVESDDVAGEILKATSSGGYDLTILGSRGIGGIKSLLLGSVSHKVARESKRSVLITKTKIENIPKILLGYDGSDESNIALAFATDIGKRFHAQVTVASVVSVPIAPEGYIGSGMDRWERETRELVESTVAKLKNEGVTADGRVIDSTDVARALAEVAEKDSLRSDSSGKPGVRKT